MMKYNIDSKQIHDRLHAEICTNIKHLLINDILKSIYNSKNILTDFTHKDLFKPYLKTCSIDELTQYYNLGNIIGGLNLGYCINNAIEEYKDLLN